MDTNKKPKEYYFEKKEEFLKYLEQFEPGLREVFLSANEETRGELLDFRVDNFANLIARHMLDYTYDERRFVKEFIQSCIYIMYYSGADYELSFKTLDRLIDTCDYEDDYSITIFEMVVESTIFKEMNVKEEHLKVVKNTLKSLNYQYINDNFREDVKNQIQEWKKRYFQDYIDDEDWLKSAQTLEKTQELLATGTSRDHNRVSKLLERGQYYKLVKTEIKHKNMYHDYDDLIGRKVQFTAVPNGIGHGSAKWIWLDERYVYAGNWTTSEVLDVNITYRLVVIQTRNTIYTFEKVD